MNAIITYIKETIAELKHVNWPNGWQVGVYTALVVVISLVIAAYLGFFDWLFTFLLQGFVI